MIEVKRKENESPMGLVYRFSKKVRQSGVLAETRKRRFKGRAVNRRKRRLSAVFRTEKRADRERQKKLGLV